MPLLKNKIVIVALIAGIAGIGIAVFVHYPKIIHHYGIGCAKENEHIPGIWTDCCPGLTADPGCRGCLSDSWTCKKPAVCGDGICETEETAATCVTDCGNTVYCGNHGLCEKKRWRDKLPD